MTRQELLARIRAARINPGTLHIDDVSNQDGYHLKAEAGKWLVYQVERGETDVVDEFLSEEEANEKFWRLVSTDDGIKMKR